MKFNNIRVFIASACALVLLNVILATRGNCLDTPGGGSEGKTVSGYFAPITMSFTDFKGCNDTAKFVANKDEKPAEMSKSCVSSLAQGKVGPCDDPECSAYTHAVMNCKMTLVFQCSEGLPQKYEGEQQCGLNRCVPNDIDALCESTESFCSSQLHSSIEAACKQYCESEGRGTCTVEAEALNYSCDTCIGTSYRCEQTDAGDKTTRVN